MRGVSQVIRKLREAERMLAEGSEGPRWQRRSASRSLRIICSGVCLRLFTWSVLLTPVVAGG